EMVLVSAIPQSRCTQSLTTAKGAEGCPQEIRVSAAPWARNRAGPIPVVRPREPEDKVEHSIPHGADEAEVDAKAPAERRLARRLRPPRIEVAALTIGRVRSGRGFAYLDADGNC